MKPDGAWGELSELYTTVGGRNELAMWLATVESMDAGEAVEEFDIEDPFFPAQLEDYREQMVGSGIGGRTLLEEENGEYVLTGFGEAWNSRVRESMSFMMSNAFVPVDVEDGEGEATEHIRDAGEVFRILGKNPGEEAGGAELVHVLANDLGTEVFRDASRMRKGEGNDWIGEAIEKLYVNGFVSEESYDTGSFTWNEKSLSRTGQEVYDEIIQPDYMWLESYDDH